MSVTPQGYVQSRYQPWQVSQPPLSVLPAHLSSLPLHVTFGSSSSTESLARAAVLGVLPHYLSMATAAPEKPVHLLRKWREATNVSSHNIPLFPPFWISFLKLQKCILPLHFTTPFAVAGVGWATSGKQIKHPSVPQLQRLRRWRRGLLRFSRSQSLSKLPLYLSTRVFYTLRLLTIL